MAQIVTITNPLTGQPAQVDQLDHTAQEIDDAIARSLPGGAIDTALQNKAPSGFGGFGEVQAIVDINNDETAFNSAIDGLLSGMKDGSSMQIRFANYPIYGNDGTIFSGFLFKSSNNYVVLHGTNYAGGSIQKVKSGGTWKPWELVNPSMVLGVEYRTQERYLGKPVYRKLIWGGPLPNSGYTGVSIASGCFIIQAVCHQTSAASASEVTPSTIGDVIPWNNNEGDGINMNAFKNHVYLWCKINRSSSNFVAYLWYIKDTD